MITKVLTDYQRSKFDSEDDSIFYAKPRFVNHLDESFRRRLTDLYREEINSNSVVLDLMSSWISHLPDEIKYKRVIGHGLNLEELKINKRLDSYWVQDVNKNQNLPLEDNSVDVCLIVAAWQYLQYPEKLAFELKRVVRFQGKLIISFSNRAFWAKSPRIWTDGTDMDRINYIKNVLNSQGWHLIEHITEETRKEEILSFIKGKGDPYFSILASNS